MASPDSQGSYLLFRVHLCSQGLGHSPGPGPLAATPTDILLARASVLAGPALVFLIVVIAIRKL